MRRDPKGRLELTWMGKDSALIPVEDGKYDYAWADPHDPRVLEVKAIEVMERVGDLEGRFGANENLLLIGDSGDVLRSLSNIPEYASRYCGAVKLVYIDPPFNTGQVFGNDYEDQLEHSIWLTMMRDRIRQMRPLLRPDASLWVHLDDAEVHRMRSLLDEEFGADKFVACIIWEKSPGAKGDAGIAVNHDYILVYALDPDLWKKTRNRIPRTEAQAGRYANPDDDPRGPWRQGADGTAKSGNESLRFPITTPSGRVVTPPAGNYWRFSQSTFDRALSEGRVWFGKKGDALPVIKTYLAEISDGVVPGTWWGNDEVGSNQEAKRDHLRKLFPAREPFSTPKPERLLQRIIQIATDEGDLVLDCFAGSGTTAAVAHKMGRRWVTSELQKHTVRDFTKPRLEKVVLGEDPWGVSATRARVPVGTLPDGIAISEAQQFSGVLARVAEQIQVPLDLTTALARKVRADSGELSADEVATLARLLRKFGANDQAVIDVMPEARKQLRSALQTREARDVTWQGGGGFTVARVGPSMYEVDDKDEEVYLSAAATDGAWSRAIAGQLRFAHTPDHPIFCGVRGRQRLAVIDGVVDEGVVRSVVEHLGEKERAVIVGKSVLPGAVQTLTDLSPGSRIKKAPNDIFPKGTVK